MRNEVIDANIAHLGDLIETVHYYNQEDTPNHILEDMNKLNLKQALDHLQSYKQELRAEIGAYLEWCTLNEVPVYIAYFRIYREL